MTDTIRAIIHIPHGIISGLLTPFNATAAILFTFGFAFYELTEDWRIVDCAYIDFRGWLIGYPIGFVLGSYLKRIL